MDTQFQALNVPKINIYIFMDNIILFMSQTINYKIIVSQDNRDTRAARKTGDKAEANDN